MTVCDSCNKEITGPDSGYVIRIEQKNNIYRYDGCSEKCCANIFHMLAEQWNKNSCNQS